MSEEHSQRQNEFLIPEGMPCTLIDGAVVHVTPDGLVQLLLFKSESIAPESINEQEPQHLAHESSVPIKNFCLGRYAMTPVNYRIILDLLMKMNLRIGSTVELQHEV